jgi:hypothetical protein
VKLKLLHNLSLFVTAFIQIFLVTSQTYYVANLQDVPVVIIGFFISWLWVGNIRKITIGGTLERFNYAFGASLGGISGMKSAVLLSKIL